MMDPLYRFTPWDHVMLGERLRGCRGAIMDLLAVAPPEGETSRLARETIAAVDRLRTEMDCHMQITRPLRRDPRRLSRHVYGGQSHFSGCLANADERALDDFAGWEMED